MTVADQMAEGMGKKPKKIAVCLVCVCDCCGDVVPLMCFPSCCCRKWLGLTLMRRLECR